MHPDLQSELNRRLSCEVHVDDVTRELYSCDASMYRIKPLAVVYPRHDEDLFACVEVAQQCGVPLLPRGGGTSLAGQCVGEAIVLDLSTHLHRVLEVNTEEGWARVQPGVVQDSLNAQLAPLGYTFGPDTATSNRATLGGMVGNNSCGAHSLIYGKTIDHVLETENILANGEAAHFGPLSSAAWQAKAQGASFESDIYRRLQAILEAQQENIRRGYPRLLRRVSGYNLDALLPDPNPNTLPMPSDPPPSDPPGTRNLSKLLVGSEGTLALMRSLKMRIVPRPKAKGLLVVHFDDMVPAMEANALILEHHPAAAELVDRRILEEARRSPVFGGKMGFLQGEPGAIVIVEFFDDDARALPARLEKLAAALKRHGFGYASTPVLEPADQAAVWAVRKGGLGLLGGARIPERALAFVEDTAVPPEHLADYLRRFRAIVERHQADCGYYGHASVGCLHVRPFIDLRAAGGLEKMMSIFEEVTALVQSYQGTMAGEHGDGLARSWLIRRMFGDELYQAFRAVKQGFDPQNRFNPGKIVDAPPPTANLRDQAAWTSSNPQPSPAEKQITDAQQANAQQAGEEQAGGKQAPGDRLQFETQLDFSRQGGFAFAVGMCNGNGQCRKLDAGTMCPSYQATRQDRHSTRGRATALRGMLDGYLPGKRSWLSPQFHAVMDLCLECKACRTECPSQVDMAKLKYEFLYHYQREHGIPWRQRFFGHVALLNRFAARFPRLGNAALANPLARHALRQLGVATQRPLPKLASRPFRRQIKERTKERVAWLGQGAGLASSGRSPVVLFIDTFTEFNHPQLGEAALQLLQRAGHQVTLAGGVCCGRPLISKGLIPAARRLAQRNLALLGPAVAQGATVVGIEPSCTLTLREDYLDLFPQKTKPQAAQALSQHTLTIEELLAQAQQEGRLPLARHPDQDRVWLHGHCHQKALVGLEPTLQLLSAVPELRVENIAAGCCGMAGSFGYEREHYDISMRIGEQRLFPAVRGAAPQDAILAAGVSCREQIAHGCQREAQHPIEFLAACLQ